MNNTFITNVDDSESIRTVIKDLLESTKEPYTIEQFKDGSELMERLTRKEEPMDIAILDIHMELGFDIKHAVDTLWNHWRQTYVIVVSGDDDIKTILHLQNVYHIWGYVLKGSDNDFGSDLKKLVYDAHLKVQDKKEHIERLLREAKQLTDGAT